MSEKEKKKKKKNEAIKSFCDFVDNYSGNLIIRKNLVYNLKNEIVYRYE